MRMPNNRTILCKTVCHVALLASFICWHFCRSLPVLPSFLSFVWLDHTEEGDDVQIRLDTALNRMAWNGWVLFYLFIYIFLFIEYNQIRLVLKISHSQWNWILMGLVSQSVSRAPTFALLFVSFFVTGQSLLEMIGDFARLFCATYLFWSAY